MGSNRQAGVGDCALLDFSKSLFAVADASDRNPSASRDFIVLFAQMMEEKALLSAHRTYSAAEVSVLKERLTVESEKLLASLPFRDGCTFTAVLLLQTADGMAAIVIHTGDSLLISFDLDAHTACQITSNNFWMVGRSQRFFQIDNLPICSTTRLLLATDGISDISVPPGAGREEFILGLFKACGPDALPDRLLGKVDIRPDGWDDTAIIAIDPSAKARFSGCIIIGGTTGLEEGSYQEERSRGMYADRYTPVLLSGGIPNQENIFLL
jgi:hypothetical protein